MKRSNLTETAIYVAFDDHQAKDTAEGERNLMRAILRSAMEDIRKCGEPQREARRYFLSEEEGYLYSFLSVCYHLNLCPRTIRTLLGITEDLRFRNRLESENSVQAA